MTPRRVVLYAATTLTVAYILAVAPILHVANLLDHVRPRYRTIRQPPGAQRPTSPSPVPVDRRWRTT